VHSPRRTVRPPESPDAPHAERAQVHVRDQSHPRSPLYVLRTDNNPRVRDGYINLGTRGYARAPATHHEERICRKNVIESARPCPLVPPRNLHGKEGVDGSSPSEGFNIKYLQIGMYRCLRWRAIRPRGYETGTHSGTGGHSRARATSGVASRHTPIKRRSARSGKSPAYGHPPLPSWARP
jgi:hypothetical protein